jgi:hypothetical protein
MREESGRDDARRGSGDGRLEQAKDAALGAHHGEPSVADEVGEAVGGVSGVLLGAAIGTAAGPVGTLIGGIAGAVGGWWSGRAVSEAIETISTEDDAHYRAHHARAHGERSDEASYSRARPAYFVGQVAARNPAYAGRPFAEIEPELRRGWPGDDWELVRDYVAEGYRRASAG